MNRLKRDATLRLLKYSFEPINYNYDELTDQEKSLISRSLFDELVNDIRTHDNEVKLLSDNRKVKLTVVVDYVKDFVDGVLGSQYAKDLESEIVKCLDEALNYDESVYKDSKIVFLCDTHGSSYLTTREGKHLPVEHCMIGTEGCELYGKVKDWYDENKENPNITLVEKSSFGEFDITSEFDYKYTDAMDVLWDTINRPELNIPELVSEEHSVVDGVHDSYTEVASNTFVADDIEICGVATNICVLSNAVILQTQFPQAEIYVNTKRVASYDPDLHSKGLDIMKGLGINIVEP